jgi:hypothetical protein
MSSNITTLFAIHNAVPPGRQLGESNTDYRRRVLNIAQSLLPADHPWAGQNLHRQPESALSAIERAVVDDCVADFKKPTGPLRELSETCARTGRVTTRFFGDPSACWEPFKQQPRRVVGWTNEGRGEKSQLALNKAAAREHVLREAGLYEAGL